MGRAGSVLVPSLSMCGDEDEFTPLKYHEFLRDRMPYCQLEIISQASYWTYIEQLALLIALSDRIWVISRSRKLTDSSNYGILDPGRKEVRTAIVSDYTTVFGPLNYYQKGA